MAIATPLLLAVLTCRLSATVDVQKPYPVELVYELEPTSAPITVPFSILLARDARVQNLQLDGTPVLLDDGPSRLRLTTAIELPPRTRTLTFRYDVVGTTIPLVVPDLPQAEPRPDAFTARITLPSGAHLVESFPVGIGEQGGHQVVSLPVLPAFVSLTLADEAPLVALPRLLEALVLVFLASVGAVLWRLR